MTLREIAPRPDERGVLLGATGSGKTTLAVRLLRLPQYRHVVVIDPKCWLGSTRAHRERGLPGYVMVRDPHQLPSVRATHIQYRPLPEYQTSDWYSDVYWWIYDRGHTFVYTDDLVLILDGRQCPDGYRACVTCGRERGVGMLHATQRPASVPLISLTESEHIYAFVLRNDNDRKACIVAGLSDAIRSHPIQEPYWFYYTGPSIGTRKLRLRI